MDDYYENEMDENEFRRMMGEEQYDALKNKGVGKEYEKGELLSDYNNLYKNVYDMYEGQNGWNLILEFVKRTGGPSEDLKEQVKNVSTLDELVTILETVRMGLIFAIEGSRQNPNNQGSILTAHVEISILFRKAMLELSEQLFDF